MSVLFVYIFVGMNDSVPFHGLRTFQVYTLHVYVYIYFEVSKLEIILIILMTVTNSSVIYCKFWVSVHAHDRSSLPEYRAWNLHHLIPCNISNMYHINLINLQSLKIINDSVSLRFH